MADAVSHDASAPPPPLGRGASRRRVAPLPPKLPTPGAGGVCLPGAGVQAKPGGVQAKPEGWDGGRGGRRSDVGVEEERGRGGLSAAVEGRISLLSCSEAGREAGSSRAGAEGGAAAYRQKPEVEARAYGPSIKEQRAGAAHTIQAYTLHPSPCTLHSFPYTLHPATCNLQASPYTLHPAS